MECYDRKPDTKRYDKNNISTFKINKHRTRYIGSSLTNNKSYIDIIKYKYENN